MVGAARPAEVDNDPVHLLLERELGPRHLARSPENAQLMWRSMAFHSLSPLAPMLFRMSRMASSWSKVPWSWGRHVARGNRQDTDVQAAVYRGANPMIHWI